MEVTRSPLHAPTVSLVQDAAEDHGARAPSIGPELVSQGFPPAVFQAEQEMLRRMGLSVRAGPPATIGGGLSFSPVFAAGPLAAGLHANPPPSLMPVTDVSGLPPYAQLQCVVRNGDVSALMGLLRRMPFRIDDRDRYGRTALHLAVQLGNPQMIRCLLAGFEGVQAAIDARTHLGLTPLHYAAALGVMPQIWLLVDHGAQWGARTVFGATPRDLARCNGHLQVARSLARLLPQSVPRQWSLARGDAEYLRSLCDEMGELGAGFMVGLHRGRLLGLLASADGTASQKPRPTHDFLARSS